MYKPTVTKMKKNYFLGIALLASTLVYSQNLDLRLYGGFNVLQLTSDEGTTLINGIEHFKKVDGRPGVQFGGVLTFGKQFYVQPGIQYSVLTTEIIHSAPNASNNLKDEATISTISVPLKIGLRFIDPEVEDFFNVRIFAGLDGTHVMSVNQTTSSGQHDINKDDYNGLIMNADFGMGLDLWFLFADVGYQLGLSPVHSGGDNAKANAFYINAGFRFGL